MVKLLKFYLRLLFIIISICSCKKATSIDGAEQRKLAEKTFKEGSHLYQGSPESMTRIENAIAIDSTYAEALRELSVAYLKRGMPHKWKPQFEKAVKHDPKTWVPMRGYLYLYFYRDYKKAIVDFNASDSLTPHLDYPQGHSVDYWRGIAYLGLKDYENSLRYWNKHILKETEDTGEDWVELEAFLYRGIAYFEAGHDEKALEDFNKVIQYFKNSADARYYKAKLLNEGNKKQEALEMIDAALTDYASGFYNQYHYVELVRQLHLSDLEELKSQIKG